jgi:sulfatase-like protein
MSIMSRGAERLTSLPLVALIRPHAAILAGLHAAAFLILCCTESDPFHVGLFVLAWGWFNFAWLVVFPRPGVAATLSLLLVCAVIVLSWFKMSVTWATLSFFDFVIVDPDSVRFLTDTFPQLRLELPFAVLLVVLMLAWVWRLDPFTVRRRTSLVGGTACLAALSLLSLSVAEQPSEPFQGTNHVSNFVRSGVIAVVEYATHGFIDAAAPGTAPSLPAAAAQGCRPAARLPHIVMVLDESSFDITAAPGVKVPPGYARHFESFDGRQRALAVEATGGPTWYAEYSVLTGLSPRSFGRFMFYVPRIAAGHVRRGLPTALRDCGYRTFTLYPESGAFMSAQRFHATAGIEHFVDAGQMGAGHVEADSFYFDQVRRTIAREKGDGPLFIFSYVTANHFPWTPPWRPELTPGWKPLGNDEDVDEYIRRQTMSANDYAAFLARLEQEFPGEPFLIVRFGDHQPWLSADVLEPNRSDETIARKIAAYDPRYFTTYYAIDAVNFKPVDVSSALDRLDVAYLPLVVEEAAGIPHDASFAEQKRILQRCNGVFYQCADGAEARRFNRMLMDAGLIAGL